MTITNPQKRLAMGYVVNIMSSGLDARSVPV